MRICIKCKVEKALDMFHKDKSKALGVCGTCKECATRRTREYIAANNEQVKAKKAAAHAASPDRARRRSREWYANNQEWAARNSRATRLKHKYGLTQEQYVEIGEAQKWRCAICGSTKSGSKNSTNLSVDHCHTTGLIRGLLCHPCNAGIGYLKEDTSIMQNAIKYLNEVRV